MHVLLLPLLFLFALCASDACAASFVHPGVLMSGAQLAAMRARVANQTEPQYTAFKNLQASPECSPDYAVKGPPANGVITCGPYSVPDIGCSNENNDADAAYAHALTFAITGNQSSAAMALRIIRIYSTQLLAYNDRFELF
jgi:hypothetical protein